MLAKVFIPRGRSRGQKVVFKDKYKNKRYNKKIVFGHN